MQENSYPEAKKPMTNIKRILDHLEGMVENIAAFMLFIVIFATFLQVIFRYLFNAPLLWTEELARYMGIWMIMFATSVALRRRTHIGVDFFTNKLSHNPQRILMVINDLVTFGVMTGLTVFSLELTVKAFNTPSPALRIPIGFVYMGMVVGYAFSALFSLFATIDGIKSNPLNSEKKMVKEKDAV